MKKLEDFLKLTQEKLFSFLSRKYENKALVHEGGYILIQGEAPIMLLAHLDTVHKMPVKDICKSLDKNILMSPQGIGGDDRCGVYALVKAYEVSLVKPWLLFTCDEEVGGVGADIFAKDFNKGKLPKTLNELKCLIEVDRKGERDAVYYNCVNSDFEAYITSKGFVTAIGSFSDISIIAPELGIAAVNLSSGYYNAHTLHEYINRKQLEAVIKKVTEIIAETIKSDFPQYEYIESNNWFEYVPSNVSINLLQMYEDLLGLYTYQELEGYRKEYGDQIIGQLYNQEFGLGNVRFDFFEKISNSTY